MTKVHTHLRERGAIFAACQTRWDRGRGSSAIRSWVRDDSRTIHDVSSAAVNASGGFRMWASPPRYQSCLPCPAPRHSKFATRPRTSPKVHAQRPARLKRPRARRMA